MRASDLCLVRYARARGCGQALRLLSVAGAYVSIAVCAPFSLLVGWREARWLRIRRCVQVLRLLSVAGAYVSIAVCAPFSALLVGWRKRVGCGYGDVGRYCAYSPWLVHMCPLPCVLSLLRPAGGLAGSALVADTALWARDCAYSPWLVHMCPLPCVPPSPPCWWVGGKRVGCGYCIVGKDCAFSLSFVWGCVFTAECDPVSAETVLVCGYVCGQGLRFRSPWYGASKSVSLLRCIFGAGSTFS